MASKRNTSYKTDGPTPNEQVRASLKNVLEQAFQNIAAVCDEHAEKKLLPGEVYEKPWITFGNPHNMVTKHHYRGVNRLGCMAMVRKFNDDRFLTFEAVWGINDDLARWKELAEAMRFGRLMETDPLPQDDPMKEAEKDNLEEFHRVEDDMAKEMAYIKRRLEPFIEVENLSLETPPLKLVNPHDPTQNAKGTGISIFKLRTLVAKGDDGEADESPTSSSSPSSPRTFNV